MSDSSVCMEDAHRFGEEYFGGNYTIEHRQFSDGDERIVVKYSTGWSPTNYLTVEVWLTMGFVWLKYVETDTVRSKREMDIGEFSGLDFDKYLEDEWGIQR